MSSKDMVFCDMSVGGVMLVFINSFMSELMFLLSTYCVTGPVLGHKMTKYKSTGQTGPQSAY